jgi:YHS domain-containing protein
MKTPPFSITKLVLAALALAIVAMPVVALTSPQPQARAGARDEKLAGKPINAMCPIGKEPIVATAGTLEYKGKTIGFCCPSCAKEFSAWPTAKKDQFVALALAGREPGQDEHGTSAGGASGDDDKSDLYTLDTCPVTGKKLGSMGEPVVKMIDGREVRFCCAGCVEPFEKDSAKYFKAIDEKLIEQQLPYYPTDKCIVMDEPLVDDAEHEDAAAANYIYKNRLVRFCCEGCIEDFNANAPKYLEQLDKLAIEHQGHHYPLDTCLVSGGKLGSMGEPVERVYGNRLVRFCCEDCIKPFEKEPAKYIATLDAAWKAMHERHPDVKPGAHGTHEHGDHSHDGHAH